MATITAALTVFSGAFLLGAPAQGAPATGRTLAGDEPPDSGTATTPALKPDLIATRAWGLVVQHSGQGRKLRFTSALGNIGEGPLEVRPNKSHPCPPGQHNSTQVLYRDQNANGRYNRFFDVDVSRHRAGCMVFHRYHDHWHFKASARYTLINPRAKEPVVVSARRKVSFCLRDSDRVPEFYGTWTYPMRYGACSRNSPQGISVGWMDIYQNFLAGQSLRLPRRLDNGLYCLRTVVDPLDQLTESNNDNNTSIKAFALRGDRILVRPQQRCRPWRDEV